MSVHAMNVDLDVLVENANSGVRKIATARRIALWIATRVPRFRKVDTDTLVIHARQDAISSRRGRKEIRRVLLQEWPWAQDLPESELERLSTELMGLLLLDADDRSKARAEFTERWSRAAVAVATTPIANPGATPMTPTIVDMTRDEFAAAAENGLEKLGLTYDQLAEQASSGDFQSQAARSLWVVIGGGYGK